MSYTLVKVPEKTTYCGFVIENVSLYANRHVTILIKVNETVNCNSTSNY